MNILLAVDIQPEYKNICTLSYDMMLKYIDDNRFNYDSVVAFRYKNEPGSMFEEHLGYTDLKTIKPIDFRADNIFTNCCYGLKGLFVNSGDTVDIIGFDTDACILAVAFALWDKKIDFRILTKYVNSTGGEHMHSAGLVIARRNFGDCLVYE